ncbi:hypothetical protein [Streptomyces sp. NBC_00557]|uniref:hypothetical protein n=1 Tax=Streptomyces sp. NBC_00557 TaxID=2975776 RepID=UPI002E81E14E|nr:hypothetical protein [Streptomyces sp. NBC_00557]WUC36336.1 hypothetical protein OG956_20000 [Streptomyces sp. NBC_00557]
MGERLSEGGAPGRHHAQPGSAASGPWDGRDVGALETVLAAAIRQGDPDPLAEQRAVAAFRAAGPHRARTRRRDDWRPPEERRARRPLKMTFGVAFASLTLGGVAVAAIGSVGSSSNGSGGGRETPHPSAVAPDRPGETASSKSSDARPTDRPASAQDTEAHCRAYEQVQGRGKALDAKVWQQLVAAAGGEAGVADYCSVQLRRATASSSADTGKSGKDSAGSGNGATGRTGTSSGKGTSNSSRTSGNGAGGTGKTGGDGWTSGQGGGKHK